MGSAGLVAFALMVLATATRLHPALVLGLGAMAWAAVSVTLWWVWF